MLTIAPSSFRRESSLNSVRYWLSHCSQNLLITAPPFAGKTEFAKQLSTEADCCAVHYCSSSTADSTEAATVFRSIGNQLTLRFPNLVLPCLSNVTLLSDCVSALLQYLTFPLASLPKPNKPLYIVIDGITSHCFHLVSELTSCLPPWLRIVLLTRPIPSSEMFRFKDFHQIVLNENVDEFARFIQSRLPQCNSQQVLECSQDSWFYVDLLSRAITSEYISADMIPDCPETLTNEVIQIFPIRFPIYLFLLKCCRRPPSYRSFLAACHVALNDSPANIEKDLSSISIIFTSKDPVSVCSVWTVDADLSPYHSCWSHVYKTKSRKTPEDIVELAFHFSHSAITALDAIETLHSLGCSDLILRCSVIDVPTTVLLLKAGATVLDQTPQDDFVYLCSIGEVHRISKEIGKINEMQIYHGLLAACSRGHIEVCKKILDSRPNILSFVSNSQWNPLRTAATNNHLDIMDLLIKSGCSVDDSGLGGRTALRAAAWAGHSEVVKRLLAAGASVDTKDEQSRTALMASAFMDHLEVVKILLEYGANIKETDSAGATALHLTLANGSNSDNHDATVQFLLESGSDVTQVDAHGRQCIHIAAFHGDKNLAKLIERTQNLDAQDSLGRTALMLASSQGQVEAVQLMLAKGCDIDSIDAYGRTSLQLAAIGGHLDVVDLLLTMGADEAHKDNDGAVALHYAVVHSEVSLCRALATAVTSAEKDSLGQTPLMIAAQNDNDQVVCELLSLGVDCSATSLDGQTALRAAALGGHRRTVQALSEFVDDWEQKDLDGVPLIHSLFISKQLSMAELLLSYGASTSSTDSHGRTCSHIVCSINDMVAAKLLHRLQTSFESKDEGGRTPLMTAVWSGHSALAIYLLDIVAVNPNASDYQGATALSVAAQLGNREMVVQLLRFGADPSLQDHMGRTALDVANISGHQNVVAILKSASGSADSSGFGSMPNSPADTKSLGRKSLKKYQKASTTSPIQAKRMI